MVKTYVAPDPREAICPACHASIKAPASPRTRRVQCPKCREVIVIGSLAGKETASADRKPPAPEPGGLEQDRLATIEARLAALEAALIRVPAATVAEPVAAPARKLQWITGASGHAPEFSAEQGDVLVHNLGTVAAQDITVCTPAGDAIASEHAAWFKEIFLRAGWTVRGPVDIAPETAGKALSLAVPELPVAQDAAKTYLALRAAGFVPITVLANSLGSSIGASPLSLTVPAAKPV